MTARSVLTFAILLSAFGCGGGKGGDGPPTMSTGGSGGSGASSSGGSAGSSGASGSGGASGSSSGGSAGSGATGCTNVFHVDGTLDGTNIQGNLGQTPANQFNAFQNWSASFVFANGGALRVEGTGEASEGDAVQGTAYFAAPASSFLNGQHFVGNASLTFSDLTKPIQLTSLAKVGECPGDSVSGSLNVCSASGLDSPECQNEFEITGTLATFPVSELHESSGHLYILEGFLDGEQVGAMAIDSQDGGFLAAEGKHSEMSGILIWPSTGARAGGTLCFDHGQKVQADHSLQIDLNDISDVGKAADATAVTGELTLTLEQCPD